jgi:hypothetical protein
MSALVNEIADLLYSEDQPMVPWDKALPEDRVYYVKVAEVIVDAVIEHLIIKDEDFSGGLRAAVEYLRAETDIARLRRTNV